MDCLTLWLSNLLLAETATATIAARDRRPGGGRRARAPAPTLLVSNEVGMGLVPETPLGRRSATWPGSPTSGWRRVADEIYAAMMGMVLRMHPAPVRAFRAGRHRDQERP